MRAKCFALIIACLVLCAVSSAQEYSIRANRGLNLRAAPSLYADIADTVTSGTTLQVVGQTNRWLKINRIGREVWLADWVNFSRLDSGATDGSQQPTAPIDNCCFVDRLCQSDKEWVAGYWAYQNGHCAAPGPAQPATSAQPAASTPATVDNCCFLDWHCQNDAEWVSGYWAFQRNQCAGPAQATAFTPSGSMPRIEGSSRFIQHIVATLNWLKSEAPEWYNYVVSGMDLIFEKPVPVLPWAEGMVERCTASALVQRKKCQDGNLLSERDY